MRLLLLNNNPAVSRLIKLSVDKVGYEMDEFEDYGLVPLKAYDVIMVDNECYEEEELKTLCEHSSCEYVVYICQRGSKKPEFTTVALEKPFLPTDFLLLLERVKQVLESLKPQPQTEDILEESEPLYEEVPQNTFDIDAIDTFGVESLEHESLNPFETLSLDEEASLEAPLRKEQDDEENALDLPLFDMQQDENETLDLSTIQTDDEAEEADKPLLNSFDFEDSSSSDASLDMLEDESAPCILDKDDINEVKQLLDESDEEEVKTDDSFSLESLAFEDIVPAEELADESAFVFEEASLEAEALALPKEEDVTNEDEAFDPNEELLEEMPSMETQEALINDFEESVEEQIEQEESVVPCVDVTLSKPLFSNAFESLDDLNENAIKKAFGEAVDEDETMEEAISLSDATIEPKDAEVIRGEIENTIARSLSGLAQSDVLREALKGMRINISITFDEKN